MGIVETMVEIVIIISQMLNRGGGAKSKHTKNPLEPHVLSGLRVDFERILSGFQFCGGHATSSWPHKKLYFLPSSVVLLSFFDHFISNQVIEFVKMAQ